MFKRKHFDILLARLQEHRRFIQVVAGPRQVGKSTMVKQVLRELGIPHLMVSAEAADDKKSVWINDVWQQARQTMLFNKYSEFVIAIDEIHKIDNWSEAVKLEWDADTFNDVNIKIVVLGSSRLLIKDGLTESLAGRFEMIEMYHWSFPEMRDAFDFTAEQYVYYGGYPGGASLINEEKRWMKYVKDSIVEPAITKDVLLTKRINKPALLRQLFDIGCSYSGEVISYNKILGQLQDAGNTDTLANYLQILDESRLLCGLQKYSVDKLRQYKSIPKYQVYNSALLSAQRGLPFEQVFVTPNLWGRWVESAVGTHIINQAKEYGFNCYYWRENALEVDFIVEYAHKIAAIEVKSGRRQDNAGLHELKKRVKDCTTIVVGGDAISVEQFLSADILSIFSFT